VEVPESDHLFLFFDYCFLISIVREKMTNPFLPLTTKPFNYLATSIATNFTLPSNSYNVIYSQPTVTSTLTLPELEDVIDGFPIIIRNFGPANLEVVDSDASPIGTMPSGTTFIIAADKQDTPISWRSILSPVSGSNNVSGPGLSTNNAIALWNGTTGVVLKNSVVIVDASGNISGVGTLLTSGAATIGGNVTLTSGGRMVYSAGGGNTTTFANTPSGASTWTFRNTVDNVLGAATTDTLTNKTILNTNNNVAANFLNSATTQVQVNGATAPVSGQVLTATGPSAANWQTLATSVGGPVSSTVSALALWNNTLGSLLKNSVVLVDGSGNISGLNNINATGNASVVGITLNTGNVIYQNGGNALTLSATPTGIRSLILPDASDTLVGRATTDTLTNKTMTSVTNNVNANGLNTTGGAGAAVIVSSAAPPSTGQALVATSATAGTWQDIPSTPFTPTTAGNWINAPTTIQAALDNLSTTVGTFFAPGVDSSVTATGATQGTAYPIVKYFTNVTTAAAGTGLILPVPVSGSSATFVVKNNGGNNLAVYPPVGATINALAANTAFTVNTGGNSNTFRATSATHYETTA
jgi:hypothetical protein